MWRWMLAVMLSLGVVVQGYASVQAMDAGCPMLGTPAAAPAAQNPGAAMANSHGSMHDAHGMHAMHDVGDRAEMGGMADEMAGAMDHGHDAAAPTDPAHHDDCVDSGTVSKHCGCATGCQPASSSLAVTWMPSATPMAQRAPVADAPSFRSHDSFRHWRPPALG